MSRFSIRNPYFIIVVCLVLVVIGVTSLARMPVDLFPAINLPEVVVATFYSGMPPEDIEIDMKAPLDGLLGLRPGGFNALFADGSVRFIAQQIDLDTMRALFTMAGGEVVQLP